jgi:hypothetical protein
VKPYRPLRMTLLLVLLCMPGVLALLPAVGPALAKSLPAGAPSIAVVLIASSVQSLVLLTVTALVGSYLTPKVGFGAPGLTGSLAQTIRQNAPIAVGAGILLGLVAVLLDAAIFRPYLPDQMYMLAHKPVLYELVPSLLYGGIAEEVMMRWGLMSLITWVFYRLFQGGNGEVRPAFVWVGIIGAALLFGLGHMPAVRQAIPDVTTAILVRTIVQNGIPGLLFGWLFARRGLESAMLAHMGFHIGMFVLRLLLV